MRSAFSSFTTCRSSAAARPRDRRQTSAATITWWRTRYAPTSARFFLSCDSDSFSPISTSKTSLACCKNGSASRTARRHSRVSFQATTTRRSGSAAMVSGTSRTGRPARSTITPGSASSLLRLRPTTSRSAARASRKSSSPGGSRALRHSMRSSERPWARKVLPLSSKRAATFCRSYWLDSVSPTSRAMNAGHNAYPATPIRVAWKRSARLIASSILRSVSCSTSTWTISVENDIAGSGLRPSTLLLLNGLQIIDDRAHVLSREDEFRHVGMAGGKALRQSLGKAFDLVFARERSEGRGRRVRADAGPADGMAARAIPRHQQLATSRGRGGLLCQDRRSGAHGDHQDEIIESLPAHMLFACSPGSAWPHRRDNKEQDGQPRFDLAQIRDAPARWALLHRSRWVGVGRVRIENSGDQGHAHEIGEARGLRLHHKIGPVGLDRPRADAKIVGNLLVGMPGHQSLEDIALAVRQRRESVLDIAPLRLALLIAIPLIERRPHGREENLVLERLFEKIHGAKSHRLHGERDISMRRDDDHRHRELELSQSSQQVDAAELGHSHVGDDAARLDRGRDLQERGGGFVRANVDAGRAQLEGKRLAHRLVVVDHVDDGLVRRHRRNPPRSRPAA